MVAWHGDGTAPDLRPRGPAAWTRAILRGLLLGIVTYGGLILLLVVRLFEWPLAGQDRPVTPYITQGVCRAALAILGIDYRVTGQPMRVPGAVIANHTSWLDIFTLNAAQRIYFVSKAEVARWPFIGWLARATGTVFIERDPRRARAQQELFEARLHAGHRLLFFPEGTSTDGRRVLPFKSTLFQAFYSKGLDHVMSIQPIAVIYRAPPGRDPRFYGWWGEMDFAPHLLAVLAASPQGTVEVCFLDPVGVEDFASRKDLAAHCERVVRARLLAGLDLAAEEAEAGQGG